MPVTHTKVLSIPDGADSSLVRPSDWNGAHTVTVTMSEISATGTPNNTNYLRGDGVWATLPTVNVPDGDKGDITVTGTGTIWTVDAGTITNTKMANMAQGLVKGRASGAGTGAPTDLTAADLKTILALQLADISDATVRSGIGTYSETITQTGTTAASGTTNHDYFWVKSGRNVSLWVFLNWATAGSALTQFSGALPSDCPAPLSITGYDSANIFVYPGAASVQTSLTATSANNARAILRKNAGNTGWEIVIGSASAAINTCLAQITYISAT